MFVICLGCLITVIYKNDASTTSFIARYIVLCRQALYQPARALLNEALQAARAFEEKELEARALFQLAKLSYYEAQYLQAVTLCMKAQVRHVTLLNHTYMYMVCTR